MAKHTTNEEWVDAISTSSSFAEALRKLGLKDCGGNYTTLHARIKQLNIDTSHMDGKGWNKGERFKPFHKDIPSSEIFCKDSFHNTSVVKRRLFRDGLKENRCECCGLTEWMNNEIPLEIHHIDGDRTNNTLENLQLLCPNCHVFTDTYRGKNMKKAR